MNLARLFYRSFATARPKFCAATTSNGTAHENMTTFGFEAVSEEEKAKRGTAFNLVGHFLNAYNSCSERSVLSSSTSL